VKEDSVLIQAYNKNVPVKRIGKLTNRSEMAVYGRIRKLKETNQL
jgi:DNA-binding Lrp family transcriptional regulator